MLNIWDLCNGVVSEASCVYSYELWVTLKTAAAAAGLESLPNDEYPIDNLEESLIFWSFDRGSKTGFTVYPMLAGTSACKNGKFFCQNIGHEPRLINASFVDDSVCGAYHFSLLLMVITLILYICLFLRLLRWKR